MIAEQVEEGVMKFSKEPVMTSEFIGQYGKTQLEEMITAREADIALYQEMLTYFPA